MTNSLDIGGGIGYIGATRTLEEQRALLEAEEAASRKVAAVSVEGGSLQDRLKLLEEQRNKDGLNSKASIVVEGGNLRDRLKLLDEQRAKDAAVVSYTTDPSQVTNELIADRRKWILKQQQQQNEGPSDEKETKKNIVVEGGNLQDRLKLLDEQRAKDAAVVSYTTDPSQVTNELIADRRKWILKQQQQQQEDDSNDNKKSIVVEGGKLQDRLKQLEEQRAKDAEYVSYTTDPSQVTYEFVQRRLAWIHEQERNASEMTVEEREAIVVEGGKLQDRLKQLEEQRAKDAEYVSYTTDPSQVTYEFVQRRLAWIHEQEKNAADMTAELPEKERQEMTRNLVAQRKAWLDDAKQKAAALPEKERIQVTQGLISERIMWLQTQKEKGTALSQSERMKMTKDLIAERLEWLLQQYARDATEEVELQINFLSEKQQNAQQMTEEEQIVMTNALLDEKVKDLETQRELTSEMTEEEQIQVTNLLIDDRQAWLEGESELGSAPVQNEEAEDANNADSSNDARTQIHQSIGFWTEQKSAVLETSIAERAQITSFLILEHLEYLQAQLQASDDPAEKESLEMQIQFLRDQHGQIDDIDHMTMIDALIDEKVKGLQQQLEDL